jgi:hypothetical protein
MTRFFSAVGADDVVIVEFKFCLSDGHSLFQRSFFRHDHNTFRRIEAVPEKFSTSG